MVRDQSQQEAVDRLAEEFVARYRRGERPAISEYCARLPDQADQIRDLFPALVMMEDIAPEDAPSQATLPRPAGHLSPGRHPERLGDYRILREVGRGGMGVVYEAEQVSLGRHVALKVLPSYVSKDAKSLERFRREARAAAKLHHSNIVPVFDVGEAEGLPFYAMQFIPGESLDQVLDELRRMRPGSAAASIRHEGDGQTSLESGTASSGTVSQMRPVPRDLTATIAGALLSGDFEKTAEAAVREDSSMCRAQVELAVADPETPAESTVDIRSDDATQPMLIPQNPVPQTSPSRSVSLSGQSPLPSLSESRPQHYYQSVARIGIQVAEALAYAHHRGVIHRDVKPSNLLLDLAGTVWITDFGLAKEREDGLTQTGDIVGTVRYMAPERFRGTGGGRSDIYSLGVTLYELATLRPAFEGADHLKLIEEISQTDPARPRSIDSRIPADLETIILKAIEKESSRRYQTGVQLADDLRAFLDYRPIQARRVLWTERTWRWCRRNPLVASLLATVALLVVAVAIIASVSAIRLDIALANSDRDRTNLRDANRELIIANQARDAQLWAAHLEQARTGRTSRQPGQRLNSLKAIRDALKLPIPDGQSIDELRTEAIAALCLPDIQMNVLPKLLPGQTALTFDRGFEVYARGDQQGNVIVCRVHDDSERFHLPVDGGVIPDGGLSFSPDGRFLHCRSEIGTEFHGRCWNVSGPEPVLVFEHDSFACAFSSTGDQCAAQLKDGSLRIYDLETATAIREVPHSGGPMAAVWADRIHRFACLDHGKFKVIDDRDGKPLLTMVGDSYTPMKLAPDGRTLAYVTPRLQIQLMDLETGTVTHVLDGHRQSGIELHFIHQGGQLASSDWTGLLRLWDLHTGQQILAQPLCYGIFQLVSDDKVLAYDYWGDNSTRLFTLIPGDEFRSLSSRQSGFGGSAVAASQADLMACHTKGGILLVDPAANAVVAELPGNRFPLRFSRDDQELWTYGAGAYERWPINSDPDDPHKRSIGPRETVIDLSTRDRWGSSADGQVVAVPNYDSGALLFNLARKTWQALAPQRDVRFCSVSPDGNYTATGSHSSGADCAAKIWDSHTGKLLAELPIDRSAGVGFSSDGRWLFTDGIRAQFWRTGTWEPGPVLTESAGRYFAFDRSGRYLAVSDELRGVVHLVAMDGGREVARLTGPGSSRLQPVCFSPDGARLFVVGAESAMLHTFDLHAIRTGLKEMGLDWDAPELPAPSRTAAPFRYHVDPRNPSANGTAVTLSKYFQRETLPAELRDVSESTESQARLAAHHAAARAEAEDWATAIAEYSRALESIPAWAEVRNLLAWHLATCPAAELRDPSGAVEHARRAVIERPQNDNIRNTLGVALYRDGEHQQAVDELLTAEELGGGKRTALNGLFLAMAYWKLGERDNSLAWFARATNWLEEHRSEWQGNPRQRDDFARLRQEAEELLDKQRP
jgi:serine/threonine protein kinase/WD40 repeat protein